MQKRSRVRREVKIKEFPIMYILFVLVCIALHLLLNFDYIELYLKSNKQQMAKDIGNFIYHAY